MIFLPALFAAATPIPAAATAYITGSLHLDRYRAAVVDLNAHGSPEILVYAQDPQYCGSGGCTLYVLSPTCRGWRVMSRMTVTRLPIRVLPQRHKGWHDLGVHVAGGGTLRGFDVRLRFDGLRYPGNPTLAPALRPGTASGSIVLR